MPVAIVLGMLRAGGVQRGLTRKAVIMTACQHDLEAHLVENTRQETIGALIVTIVMTTVLDNLGLMGLETRIPRADQKCH